MSDHYILPSELAILLAVSWLPVFAVAAVIQWPAFRRSHPAVRSFAMVGTFLVVEAALAMALWVSPLSSLFLVSNALPSFLATIVYPFQAAVLSAALVTFGVRVIWRNKGVHAQRAAT